MGLDDGCNTATNISISNEDSLTVAQGKSHHSQLLSSPSHMHTLGWAQGSEAGRGSACESYNGSTLGHHVTHLR